MDKTESKNKGYVYILDVKDIDLPVCKIGMTSSRTVGVRSRIVTPTEMG